MFYFQIDIINTLYDVYRSYSLPLRSHSSHYSKEFYFDAQRQCQPNGITIIGQLNFSHISIYTSTTRMDSFEKIWNVVYTTATTIPIFSFIPDRRFPVRHYVLFWYRK